MSHDDIIAAFEAYYGRESGDLLYFMIRLFLSLIVGAFAFRSG